MTSHDTLPHPPLSSSTNRLLIVEISKMTAQDRKTILREIQLDIDEAYGGMHDVILSLQVLPVGAVRKTRIRRYQR